MRPIPLPALAAAAVAGLALVAVPLSAQLAPAGAGMMGEGMTGGGMTGAGSPGDVAAGTYAVEPAHTQVTFSVTHFGITPFSGQFSGASGTLRLDPAHPAAAALTVSLPVASVQTTSARLTEELRGADWLDAGRFPTATFTSSAVTPTGAGAARIDGTLTLHGVTRPASISARFFGAATNPMSHKASVGFTGRMTFKRSDFGVAKYVPVVSDETVLTLVGAFEKQ